MPKSSHMALQVHRTGGYEPGPGWPPAPPCSTGTPPPSPACCLALGCRDSRFTHAIMCNCSSFIFHVAVYFVGQPYHNACTHFNADGHLGCFQIGLLLNYYEDPYDVSGAHTEEVLGSASIYQRVGTLSLLLEMPSCFQADIPIS